MEKPQDIIKKLQSTIRAIREKIKKLIQKKQEEIKTLKKIDQNYNYLGTILDIKLPLDSEGEKFLGLVYGTASTVNFQISQQFMVTMQNEVLNNIVYNTSASGVSAVMSYPDFAPLIPVEIKKEIYSDMAEDHETKKEKIKDFLNKISPHLVDIYLSAYENLDITVHDPERGALGLIREVINQVLGLLAPDEEIKQNAQWFTPDPNSKTGITRKYRVRYIAETKTKNEEFKKILIETGDLFDDTVNALNKFHKRGKLSGKETRSFLYQAEQLLEILCDSINI